MKPNKINQKASKFKTHLLVRPSFKIALFPLSKKTKKFSNRPNLFLPYQPSLKVNGFF